MSIPTQTLTSLGEVGTTFGGLSGKVKEDFGRGPGRYVTFMEVMRGARLFGDSLGRVEVGPGERQNEVQRGDVLFNGSSETPEEVALGAVVNFDVPRGVYLNSFCFGYRISKPGVIDPTFLAYFTRSSAGRQLVSALAQGATRYNIAKMKLMQVPLVFPSYADQKEIAKAFIDVDDLIASLERLIAKKRAIKQGMMQELLTGRTRLPGFFASWERRIVKDIVATPVTDGPHLTPEFLNEGVPFLSVNNLVDGRIDWSDLRYISRADHELFSRKCRPRQGDVLMGKAASVGRVAYLDTDREVNIWSPIALIRPDAAHHARFVHYQLQSESTARQIELLTNTSSQGNIGMGEIEKIELALPPHCEQHAIARVLLDADNEIDAIELRLAATRSINQGMMQELLTGRTRLPVEEGTQ